MSAKKKDGPPETIMWLKDRSKEWQCPAVVYEDAQFGTGYEPLGCKKMDVSLDCYWSTGVVTIHGEWTNYLPDDKQNFIFVLKTRGSITDCTIKIKGRHVRTVATINNKMIQENTEAGNNGAVNISMPSAKGDNDNARLPKWSEKEYEIFGHSSKAFFYLPFNDVASGEVIEIDCEYVESLRLVQGYYYFQMPLTFYDTETNQSMFAPQQNNGLQDDISFEQRVKVRCRINHSNSMGVQDFKCPSHQVSYKTETNCLTFETGKTATDEQYANGLKIQSTIHGNNDAIVKYYNSMAADQNVDISPQTAHVKNLGRPFELFFRYGVTMRHDELAIEKSNYQAKYGDEPMLGSLISCHVLNNQLRQHFNWQFSQAKRREKKDYNYNNRNDNYIVNDLDTSLASLGVFMTVTDPLKIRRSMPLKPCCLYFVINGCSPLINTWDLSIVEAVAVRVSTLELCDAFGICVFNEVNVRHFVAFQDELKHGGDIDVADENEAANEFKSQPHVYTMKQYQEMYANNPNGDSWQNQLLCEVRDWLDSHAPLPRKALKKVVKDKNKQKDVNISKPLMQTLCFLESEEYKTKYFKQIAFIHQGKKLEQETTDNSNNNKKNGKNGKNNNKDENDEKQTAKLLKNMEIAMNSNNGGDNNASGAQSEMVDIKAQAEEDVGEQELMSKIAFFYSSKAKEFLNMDPYTTRIYTIGLGSSTNFAFLEYLARNTRAFSARCFDGSSFTWDLTHFLDSIRAPFVSFDGAAGDPVQFIYTSHKKGETSHLSFPFPIPDLYLDRPLILKYYVESPAKLKDVIVHGSYMNDQGIQVKELAYAHVQGNEVIDNEDFPMEILLCNEEIDYWHGDYWFKRNNYVFKQSGAQSNDPFRIFGSVDKEQAESIIGDLSDQTGIASEFRTMVSFCMTNEKYIEYTREIESQRELSKQEMSRLSQSFSIDESRSQVMLGHQQGNKSYQLVNEVSVPGTPQSMASLPSGSSYPNTHFDNEHKSQGNNNNNNNNNNENGGNGSLSTTQMRSMRNRMNKRGAKNNKNKAAAVAAVVVLGTLGVATLLNPFDGDGGGGGDTFEFGFEEIGGDCGDCGGECDGCDFECGGDDCPCAIM